MIRTIHRAAFVLAEPGILIPNGAVHVSDSGRISKVEPWNGGSPVLEAEIADWGFALILPGLVNAHTHLELSGLGGKFARPERFTDWLLQVIRRRRETPPAELQQAVRFGAGMALSGGTTLLGDISSCGAGRQALQDFRLRKVVFEEAIALDSADAASAASSLARALAATAPDELLAAGISPHAPYSVSPPLYRMTAALAREKNLPLATHLAETAAEAEFLLHGTGELVDFLGRLGKLPAGWRAPGLAPVPYLEGLGVLGRYTLLIHCNYLDADSVARIRLSQSTVVYCPRSHAFFGHQDHPVRLLLDAGVNVALGTDSLASNDSLCVLDEMRYLFGRRKDLRADEIFAMATINGAAALMPVQGCGRLRQGCWADMAVIELPQGISGRRLAAEVLEGAGRCVATVVRGQVAWQL